MTNNQNTIGKKEQSAWRVFNKREQLTEKQLQQFQQYLALLLEWNKKFNITAIVDPVDVIDHHFSDSLQLDRFVDMKTLQGLCDVGSGGGFPGIPLKIKHPSLFVVLVEVSQKKIAFLQHVITELGLEGIEVCAYDWRTFLRKTEYPIDLVCARASLHPDELMRMFKMASWYKQAQLVYFASKHWEPEAKEKPFLRKIEKYTIDNKPRQLAFFGVDTNK